ncbi:MAG: elongation factor G [bacterium]|nr:elongation factor G [bacterium]MCP4965457.1 elongation factor G [bacterium]
MKVYPPEKIRNVALVGHSGAGKTTLAEALLYRAGTISRLGRVEEGNTVTDFDPEEHERGHSLSLALAPIEWNGHKINIIDTPGHTDFVADVYAGLHAADLAVFVVSATDGVEVGTERAWRAAEELGLPRMIFINKLDKEEASFDRTLESLQERFGAGIAPIELPIGEGPSFHGIADLFTDKAYIYDSGSGQEAEIPEELEAKEHEVHDNLVEGIVVADDDLLEKYLEGEVPGVEELEETMAKGVASGSVFPVVCGSATGPIAVDRLADFILEIGPSPLRRQKLVVTAAGNEVEIDLRSDGDPLVQVFKTIADPYVGQISLFRVLSGKVTNELVLHNQRSNGDEKLAKVASMVGKESELVDSLPMGDLGAVAKLNDTATGDTLSVKSQPITAPPLRRPTPVLATAIHAKTQADTDKLANALRRIQQEDPVLIIDRNAETHQTLMRGMGETHLTITQQRLSRKFGVEVETEPVRVPYRETISRRAQAEGKYKKQSGGHGQFGVAMLKVEPTQRGNGFEFVDEIKGGSIPRQFIPAVEQGIRETMVDGGVLGFPVVDVRVRVYDGKYHSVDSSEMSFKMAGRLGFKAAMSEANPIVLEPVSQITVSVPSNYQGEVMGDLSSRRGQVQGTEASSGGRQMITALVPTSEIISYAMDLRSITQGWGSFTAEHDHYQELPSHLTDKVVAEAKEDD